MLRIVGYIARIQIIVPSLGIYSCDICICERLDDRAILGKRKDFIEKISRIIVIGEFSSGDLLVCMIVSIKFKQLYANRNICVKTFLYN